MDIDIFAQQGRAFLGIEVDDLNRERTQPLNPALKVPALADDQRTKAELPHQPAAIPARSESRNHDEIAIAALASRFAEGVGFAVQRRIAALHAAVVASANDFAVLVENSCADRDAALGEPLARFR